MIANALSTNARKDADAAQVLQFIRAHAAYNANKLEEASKRLSQLSPEAQKDLFEPIWLLHLRVADALNDGQKVRQAARKLLNGSHVSSQTKVEARFLRATHNLKSEERASSGRKELRALLNDSKAWDLRPAVLEKLAQSSKSGKAKSYLKQLVINFGATPQGRWAATQMSVSSLSQKQKFKRVKKLFKARAYEVAEESLKELISSSSGGLRQECQYLLGVGYMRLRIQYEEALALFEAASKGPGKKLARESVYRRALILGNLRRHKEASDAMRGYVSKFPKGEHRSRAAYQVGRLLHQRGDFARAAIEHELFVQDHSSAPTWRWFLGWSYFRAKKYRLARQVWRSMQSNKNLLIGAKTLYWSARSYLLEGNRVEAKRELEHLLRRAQYGYYGLLGTALYQQEFDPKGSRLPKRIQKTPVSTKAYPDLRAIVLREKRAKHLVKEIAKVQMLSASGFPKLARDRFKRRKLDKKLKRALSKKGYRAMVDGLDLWLERWNARWRRVAPHRLPWNDGFRKKRLEKIVEAFPAPYIEVARAAGKPYNVSPWWLLSHMLQESRYKEQARSHAGALGTMQILPRTGLRIAQRTGFPRGAFRGASLFEPGVGLKQAAWYLSELRKEFNGNILMAIAAYNGGPLRMAEYLTLPENQGLPMDIFIEEIGAHESRNYVRKVTDHLVRNLTVYGTEKERAAYLKALIPAPQLPKARGELRF